jgi:hypothetical protein
MRETKAGEGAWWDYIEGGETLVGGSSDLLPVRNGGRANAGLLPDAD